jgi:hypothetical protein
MHLEKIVGVNLDRLAVSPDSDIPLTGSFFPFFFWLFSVSIRYLYFFSLLFCLYFYISSDISMRMSVLNLQNITGPHLQFALVKITVLW